MKKILVIVLSLSLLLSFSACSGTEDKETTPDTTAPETETTAESETETETVAETETETEAETDDPSVKSEGVMTYAEYVAAELDTQVVIEAYVQAKQSWWEDKATVYTQDADGAYFLYNMACSEEDYAKLTTGTKIKVTGYKSEWSGEVEIMDATFEILDDGDSYIAEPLDVTELLGTDALIDHQNQFVSFTGMTVEAYDETGAAFAYKNEADKTDDLYFKVSYNGQTYDFCVEYYLCGSDTDVYTAV